MLPRDGSCHPSAGKQPVLACCQGSGLSSVFFPCRAWMQGGLEHSPAGTRQGERCRPLRSHKCSILLFRRGRGGCTPTPHGTTHARGDVREKTRSVRRLHLPCPARPCPALSCPQALQLCSHPQGGMAPLLGLRRRPGGSPRPCVLTAHGSRGRPWICTSCHSVDS